MKRHERIGRRSASLSEAGSSLRCVRAGFLMGKCALRSCRFRTRRRNRRRCGRGRGDGASTHLSVEFDRYLPEVRVPYWYVDCNSNSVGRLGGSSRRRVCLRGAFLARRGRTHPVRRHADNRDHSPTSSPRRLSFSRSHRPGPLGVGFGGASVHQSPVMTSRQAIKVQPAGPFEP